MAKTWLCWEDKYRLLSQFTTVSLRALDVCVIGKLQGTHDDFPKQPKNRRNEEWLEIKIL